MIDDDILLAELGDFELTDEYLADKLVSREVATARLNVCNGCEFFEKTVAQCTKTGWVMPEAVGSKVLVCPEAKWS